MFPRMPPPNRILPVIQRLITTYKLWHDFFKHISKPSRYTLGAKIDLLFIEILELLFLASYIKKQEKLPYLKKAIEKLDILKFFLKIMWEIKTFNNKKYIALSEHLYQIGKMLYGWYDFIAKNK